MIRLAFACLTFSAFLCLTVTRVSSLALLCSSSSIRACAQETESTRAESESNKYCPAVLAELITMLAKL